MCRGSFFRFLLLSYPLVLTGCAAGAPASGDLVEEAKAVISSHEQYAAAGDLDGVMSNIHPEVLTLTAGSPLVQGSDAFREFYAQLLGMGAWSFTHDYHGGDAVGDIVELFGVARGTVTPENGAAIPFENNFVLQLRRADDGRLKVWRASFAPLAP